MIFFLQSSCFCFFIYWPGRNLHSVIWRATTAVLMLVWPVRPLKTESLGSSTRYMSDFLTSWTLNRSSFSFVHDMTAAHQLVVMKSDGDVVAVVNPPPGVMSDRLMDVLGGPWQQGWQLMCALIVGVWGGSRWIWRNPVYWWELPGGGVWPWSSCTLCTPPASAPGPPSGHFCSSGEREGELYILFLCPAWMSL